MEKSLQPYHINEEIWMVPCISNREGNTYQPICTPLKPNSETKNLSYRQPWSQEEDKALEELTNSKGTKAWTLISREINNLFHDGKPYRKGRQCRERFFNHINPNLKKGQWTSEEDYYILQMQNVHGNKWSEIAKNLPGRNENQVKNRWKSLIKKNIEKNETQPIQISLSSETDYVNYTIESLRLSEMMQSQYFSQCSISPFHFYFP